MKERFLKLKDSAVEFWTRTNKRQRMIAAGAAGAVALLAVAVLMFALIRGGQKGFEPLFTNLEPEDASAIVQELKKTKTPYTIEQSGKAVLVDKKMVYELRNELAAKGLPAKSTVGYELFDATRLGVTDFTQKVN
ncbi:MAG TPA: flagellar M-ring protein FliF, partial [bacterium]|nr:flagellar M-ring protein FliF [bacterium]